LSVLAGFLMQKTDDDFLSKVHLQPATPAQIANGQKLVKERGCTSCHEIEGMSKPENFAPDLTGIGSSSLARIVFAEGVEHTLPDYMEAKIQHPHSFGRPPRCRSLLSPPGRWTRW